MHRNSTYFRRLADDRRMLSAHGFTAWPDGDELTRYACELDDGLQALAGALDVELTRDIRGQWHAIPRQRRSV